MPSVVMVSSEVTSSDGRKGINHRTNLQRGQLLWKCLPDRTLVSCREKSAPGFKKSKDRLTVLGCTNARGTHKLKPVMIGKFAKPRCFKNVNMDALPSLWFKKDFVLAVKCHQCAQNICSPKALLLIDNCSAHPQELKTRNGSVTCMFLPRNTTLLIQPMDQGVLQAMKNRYKRRKLLQEETPSESNSRSRS